jgi:hypothetical protein
MSLMSVCRLVAKALQPPRCMVCRTLRMKLGSKGCERGAVRVEKIGRRRKPARSSTGSKNGTTRHLEV